MNDISCSYLAGEWAEEDGIPTKSIWICKHPEKQNTHCPPKYGKDPCFFSGGPFTAVPSRLFDNLYCVKKLDIHEPHMLNHYIDVILSAIRDGKKLNADILKELEKLLNEPYPIHQISDKTFHGHLMETIRDYRLKYCIP
jgi:hypothetical protein